MDVFKRNSQIKLKVKYILDKYIELSYNYQSKLGYYILIQNVILAELMNLMSLIKGDIFIELEMKISRIKKVEF